MNSSQTSNYVWHPYYVDALAMRWREDITFGVPTVTEHYYLQDANFNVTAVTDESGTVVERYNYTPYGEVTVLDANFVVDADGLSDIKNTHYYTGRELDRETGLQLNRNRYYASHLGRWINRDPIGYEGGDANLYEYVSARPMNYVDPSGLKCCPNGNTGCCDQVPYDTRTECCENGEVVAKVPIWICSERTILSVNGIS